MSLAVHTLSTPPGQFFEPCGSRVLVRRKEAGQTYGDSPIIVPERDRERPLWGTVVAVGPGSPSEVYDFGGADRLLTPPPAALGSTVLFAKYAGEVVELDGVEYLLLGFDEVLAVMRDPAPEPEPEILRAGSRSGKSGKRE